MSRLFLHPLRGGGKLTRTPPGQWARATNADQLADIDLTEAENRERRGRISSVPSPWARLQMFRDAVLDDRHPMHVDALNDILDVLEVILFQDFLDGVQLRPRRIHVPDVTRKARGAYEPGVQRFAAALEDLAPVVAEQEGERGQRVRLTDLTVVLNGKGLEAPAVFATSPYTLFFTPEARRFHLPGYFVPSGIARPLSKRPPAVARYVREVLLPGLRRGQAGRMSELQQLAILLERQLGEVRRSQPAGDEDLPPLPLAQWLLEPVPDLALHRLTQLPDASPLAIRPTRTGAQTPPLALDNSAGAMQWRYFDWLERPATAQVGAALARDILPGTAWKREWVYPEVDFFVEKLLVLDAPVHSDRVYAPAVDGGGRGENVEAAKVLLPLTKRFFELFRPEDVPRMLKLRTWGEGPSLRVQATLTIPIVGPDAQARRGLDAQERDTHALVVQRTYDRGTGSASFLSLWPGFAADAGSPWHDYYLNHFLDGADARDEIEIEVGADGKRLPMREVQRDLGNVIYHFRKAPQYIRLRARHASVGDAGVAEGVLLPKLRSVAKPNHEPWVVAIDFGTSNTVVAYRENERNKAPKALEITEATRFDLTQGKVHELSSLSFDTYFFPERLEGKPFGTVILKNRMVDPADPLAAVPALTANIPFHGEVSGASGRGSAFSNEVVGDLKWGGGGTDSERLTTLFLQQILQVVYAEAIAAGARTEGLEVRWSYPIAFAPGRQRRMAARWRGLLTAFSNREWNEGPREDRDAVAAPPPTVRLRELDESTASLLYFRTDPAAQDSFDPDSPNMKLTADVGGGTTDLSAYGRGALQFRTSMLFGGRDLVDGLYGRLEQWALPKLKPQKQRVLAAYPTNHTKFTYLVRQPAFIKGRAALTGEPWFAAVQACILYFFGAIAYNIGFRLRVLPLDGDVRLPNVIFFGGNGSTFLHWLTEFEPWQESPKLAREFSAVLQNLLEAGYATRLGHRLSVRTSSRPKLEVALGLLNGDAYPDFGNAAGESWVGEDVSLVGDNQRGHPSSYTASTTLSGTMLSQYGISRLKYELPFSRWEIKRFNDAFAAELPKLGRRVDNQWLDVAERVKTLLGREFDERFYQDRVPSVLKNILAEDSDGTVSLFVIEATATLRELERELLSG